MTFGPYDQNLKDWREPKYAGLVSEGRVLDFHLFLAMGPRNVPAAKVPHLQINLKDAGRTLFFPPHGLLKKQEGH